MAVAFHFKDDALETFLKECVEAYAENPTGAGHMRIAATAARQQEKALRKQSGMSIEGNLRMHACVPGPLLSFIRQQSRKRLGYTHDLFRSQKTWRLFLRIYQNAKIKTKPTPFHDGARKCPRPTTKLFRSS